MTRATLRLLVLGLGALVVLGLGVGYVAGLMMTPAPLSERAGPAGPAEFAAGGGAEVGIPGYENIYVNDYADLLDDETEAGIKADLIELHDETGVEMTVLTIPSRAHYGFEGTNEAFATALFNAWGIGDAERNDGVLVLVDPGDREMRIELGRAYGSGENPGMKRVIDDTFIPYFSQGRYQEGIDAGVDEVIRRIAGVYPGLYQTSTVVRGWTGIGDFLAGLGAWALGLLAVPLGAAAWGWRAWQRARPRDCPQCGTAMVRQAEDVDDAHLDGGQRLEEYVRSVDYDVWECPSCHAMEITRWPAWFSNYGTCPECNYRTLNSTTEILEHATTSSTGRKRIDYGCENCGHAFSETRTIPKVSKSSSGSSGSSFGGGSSSGGSASGSW